MQSNDEQITQLRQDFERQAKEIESKYEKKMRALRDELDLRRKTEIHEIEERKNGQINTLMKNHEKAFSDIKNYYNDITLNNLALINTLKVSDRYHTFWLTETNLTPIYSNSTHPSKRHTLDISKPWQCSSGFW